MKALTAFLYQRKETDKERQLSEFKNLYLQYKEFIRASIYWMVNSHVVDDLIQETFLNAWRSYHSFREDASFKSWIYRIAMNATYDYLNQESRVVSNQDEESYDHEDFAMGDLISKGLMNLNPESRELFSLHYQQGFTYLEISELIGVAEGTVKSRVHKSKKQFVEFLKKNGVSCG